MKRLFLSFLILSGCSVQVKPDEQTVAALQNHQAILEAISDYVSQLQEKGVLPKPDDLEKKPE